MIRTWKAFPMLKGTLTWIPKLHDWRLRHSSTGGSDSPRYCYSVWLRHLVLLSHYGFDVRGAKVGELGPGDSLGAGLAALLAGAAQYVGLDVVPFSAKADLENILAVLVDMYGRRESIPDHNEFPGIQPMLRSYELPEHLIEWADFSARSDLIRHDLAKGMNCGEQISYQAPWFSADTIAANTLDLVFSQAVLEHVENLEETYKAMFAWLKPGGYASHVVDFGSHRVAPLWNGHWAYSEREWRFVRGGRSFLINREPLSTHLSLAKQAGFDVLRIKRQYDDSGFETSTLSKRYRTLDAQELRTRGVLLILRKTQ